METTTSLCLYLVKQLSVHIGAYSRYPSVHAAGCPEYVGDIEVSDHRYVINHFIEGSAPEIQA